MYKNLHGYIISAYGIEAYTKLFLCEDIFDALMMFAETFELTYDQLAAIQKDKLLHIERLNTVCIPYEALTLGELEYLSKDYYVFCDAGDKVVRLVEKIA